MITNVNEFKVGDEVMREGYPERYVVSFIDKKEKIFCGFGANGASFMDRVPTTYYPTGKFYEEVPALIEKLKNEPEHA